MPDPRNRLDVEDAIALTALREAQSPEGDAVLAGSRALLLNAIERNVRANAVHQARRLEIKHGLVQASTLIKQTTWVAAIAGHAPGSRAWRSRVRAALALTIAMVVRSQLKQGEYARTMTTVPPKVRSLYLAKRPGQAAIESAMYIRIYSTVVATWMARRFRLLPMTHRVALFARSLIRAQ